MPGIVKEGSTPLSNLYLASVIMFSFLPVIAVEIGSKYADY